MDQFSFSWNGFKYTFFVKPDIYVRPDCSIWGLTRLLKVEYDGVNWLGHTKHKVVEFDLRRSFKNSLEEWFKDELGDIIISRTTWTPAQVWKHWDSLCAKARRLFVREHIFSRSPFEMEMDTEVEGLKIIKDISFVDKNTKAYIPVSLEWKISYNLDGVRKDKTTSRFISEVSKTSRLELVLYIEGYESARGQMLIDNSKPIEELLRGTSILNTVFNEIRQYVPAFDVEDVETIFNECTKTFWEKLPEVNKNACSIATFKRDENELDIEIGFGNGSFVQVGVSVENKDCVATIRSYYLKNNESHIFKETVPLEELNIYKLVSPIRIKEEILWLLKNFEDPGELPTLVEEISEKFEEKFKKELPMKLRKEKEMKEKDSDLWRSLSNCLEYYHCKEYMKGPVLNDIEELILQSNNSLEKRRIFKEWLKSVQPYTGFYEEVLNLYNVVAFVKENVVRSPVLGLFCSQAKEGYEEKLMELVESICEPHEVGSTYFYYKAIIEKNLQPEGDLKQEFNNLKTMLKNVEECMARIENKLKE